MQDRITQAPRPELDQSLQAAAAHAWLDATHALLAVGRIHSPGLVRRHLRWMQIALSGEIVDLAEPFEGADRAEAEILYARLKEQLAEWADGGS